MKRSFCNMFKKCCIYSIFLICLIDTLAAQTFNNPYPNIIQPSPNAASLGRYSEIPVSIETGVPSINIPFYVVKSSNITVPISLSYHASGIKVMDQASSVGLGWVLNAGGSITRIKQGVYDEDVNGFYNVVFPDDQDPDFHNKMDAFHSGMNIEGSDNPNKIDGQPDIFYYSFAGKSGKFMFKNRITKGLPPEILTFPYSSLKILFLDDWKTIQITDDDGTRYFFGKSLEGIDYREMTTWGTFGPSNPDGKEHASSWHLVNIVPVNDAEIITFKYDFTYVSELYNKSYSINEEFSDFGAQLISSTNATNETVSRTNTKLLTEVKFLNGKVLFSYSTTPGTNLRQLDNISVYNKSNFLKAFSFSYSRFKNNGVEVSEKNALRLDSCREIGKDLVPSKPFVFTYFAHQNFEVPPFNDLAPHSEDLWGYFNNSGVQGRLLVRSNDASGVDANTPPISVANVRKVDSNYLKVGTLSSIKYPTGGVNSFDLEPNQCLRNYVRNDTAFSFFSKYISTFNADVGSTAYATLTFNEPRPLLQQTVRISTPFGVQDLNFNAVLKFNVVRFCNPSTDLNCKSISGIDLSFVDITTGAEIKRWQWDGLFYQDPSLTSKTEEVYVTIDPTHTYQMRFNYPSVLDNNSQNFAFRMNGTLQGKFADYTVTSTPVSENVLSGGLRTRKLTSADPISGKSTIKVYNYLNSYFNSVLFDGDFDKLATKVFSFDRYKWWGTSVGKKIKYRTYTENLTVPIGSANNSSASYEQVEEVEIDPVTQNVNGKTVYSFSKKVDWVTPFLPFYKFDNSDQRSQLLNKKVYSYIDNTYKLLNEVKYVYKDLTDLSTNTIRFILSNMTFFDDSYYNGHNDWYVGLGFPGNGGRLSEFRESTESLQSSKFLTDSVITTDYTVDINPLTIITKYSYTNPTISLPTETIINNSKNGSKSIVVKYPFDKLPIASCANSCESDFVTQLNILKNNLYQCQAPAIQMFRDNQVYNASGVLLGDPLLLAQARSDYQTCQNAFESAVINLGASKESCAFQYASCKKNYYDNTNSDTAAIYELFIKNVIAVPIDEATLTDGRLTSTKKSVYKIFDQKNTNISKIKTGVGNNPIEDDLLFHRYDLHGNILEVQKRDGLTEAYLWGYNNQYPVAKIAGANFATVNSVIDTTLINNPDITDSQLRTELSKLRTDTRTQNAQVSSYTYRPLVGMTSETDPAGRTTFYEYDAFGRLNLVKDEDGNILKRICYNYAGQVTDCGSGRPAASSAQWVATGNTRCVKDGSNNNTGYQEREERDNNTGSATYNQMRWVNMGSNTSTCPLPNNGAQWVATGNMRCIKDGSNNNTGSQEREERDQNTTSATYNQTRWVSTGTNTTACPLPSGGSPNWQVTGTTRCVKDGSNNNTGIQEREERDQNTSSATYNQTRWVSTGTNTTACPLPNGGANWQATGNTRCVKDGSNNNTGYQEREERDNNTGSATYNQTRWVSTGENTTACPVPATAPNWQPTGAVRCEAVNNINTGNQERKEVDMNAASATYMQERWVSTGANATACPLNYRSVSYINKSDIAFTVTFTNVSNNQTYIRTASPTSPTTYESLMNDLPSGTYNITAIPESGTATMNFEFSVNGGGFSIPEGSSMNLESVMVTHNAILQIKPYYDYPLSSATGFSLQGGVFCMGTQSFMEITITNQNALAAGQTYLIGTIAGCRPSQYGDQSVTVTRDGNVWLFNVKTNGEVYLWCPEGATIPAGTTQTFTLVYYR